MKIKDERDFWSGLAFIAVGVGFAIGAMNYSMGPPCNAGQPCAAGPYARFAQLSAHPGAGFFPLGLSILLAMLGAFIVFTALTIESPEGHRVGPFAWKPLGVIVAAIAIFGAMLEPLGMLLSIPVLILIVSFAGDEFHWPSVVGSMIVLTVSSWAIFILGLKLTIPVWPWFAR